ncbi:MAG: glycosyltransferase family 2 protein [Pseudomonadaceae bacterium]|nr:glycosyltransferase family 2 protein [Pseudomonadaceae bacterium]
MSAKLVSVVVPCYNEEEVIAATLKELAGFMKQNPRYDFEVVLVDDGSKDRTLEMLRAAARKDARLKVVSFARNFGHQFAVTAGIDAAAGDAVVLIDADLQDPPEVVAEMLAKWEEGYDVVYGVRRSREGESAFKLATARAFYRVLNGLSEVPIPLDVGDFRLMARPVVEVLAAMPERHRFIRGMVAWAGFRQYALPYDRKRRVAGVSKYPLLKMIRFAKDGILSFSSRPLQVATSLGSMASFVALLGIVYALVLRIFTSTWVEGWTALMIAVLFMGGVQLLCLGIIGEYIGRIYEQGKGRPLYVVRERIGFDAGKEKPRRKVRKT